MFEVTVSAEVAFTKIDGGGTRRVKLADGTVLTFSRQATLLKEVPAEVAADKHLVVRKVGAKGTAPAAAETASGTEGGTEPSEDSDKKGDRVQVASVPPSIDVETLNYNELVKLAHELEVDAAGKQEVLRDRLRAHIAKD